MKAKMPKGQKPVEPADYECIWCETICPGDETDRDLLCPNCGARDRRDLVPIYMTNNPLETVSIPTSTFQAADQFAMIASSLN